MALLPFLDHDTLKGLRVKIRNTFGIHFEPWTLLALGFALLVPAFMLIPDLVMLSFSIALFLSPLWLPLMLPLSVWKLWYIFKRSEFIAKQTYILLEIKPPRNLVKTPLAMEAFLSAIHLTGNEATWYQRFMGGIRPYWSLEIASFEGRMHFFIWGRAALRRLVESQPYAQHPG